MYIDSMYDTEGLRFQGKWNESMTCASEGICLNG